MKKDDFILGAIIGVGTVLLIILGLAISWAATAGIIWLISLCFPFTFSWKLATGIWLTICLIKWGLGIGSKSGSKGD